MPGECCDFLALWKLGARREEVTVIEEGINAPRVVQMLNDYQEEKTPGKAS